MKILAMDPSGNFNEGKGTTGWALLDENGKIIACGQLLAVTFDQKELYWDNHLLLIDKLQPDVLVIEDFLLYANRSQNQINSRFETPKLIGIIELFCWQHKIELAFQKASEVKLRWNDERLILKGFLSKSGNRYYAGGVQITEHIRDAIRHGVHYITFKLKKE